jgi:mannose/cellobiose epimerase-like protein (N-acyl-D-glucosamine 2-epimerase family)
MTNKTNFRTRSFLLDHVQHTMDFYEKSIDQQAGGFYQFYKDDGTVYDSHTRHLVSSTRFIFNYAMAYVHFGRQDYLERTRHGLDYIRRVHRNHRTGGYAWLIYDGRVIDDTNHCYGLAFVMLAYACAVRVGIDEARQWLRETYDLMEKYFWLEDHGRYASEATGDWQLKDYRGQNDNMHACEAMLAAYEVTLDQIYLERAKVLADVMTRSSAELHHQIWEHYHVDWTPDFDYNRNVRTNIFRPWGVQTGHQTEWAKLLLILDRFDSQSWHVERAVRLFDRAVKYGWDEINGGLIYGYDLDGHVYDADKYFWVQAESLATAALLADRLNDNKYWQWYDRIWQYSWTHFVDHHYGSWYRILTPTNEKYSDEKSPAGKTDYHTMGVCYELLSIVEGNPST